MTEVRYVTLPVTGDAHLSLTIHDEHVFGLLCLGAVLAGGRVADDEALWEIDGVVCVARMAQEATA